MRDSLISTQQVVRHLIINLLPVLTYGLEVWIEFIIFVNKLTDMDT